MRFVVLLVVIDVANVRKNCKLCFAGDSLRAQKIQQTGVFLRDECKNVLRDYQSCFISSLETSFGTFNPSFFH